VGPCGATPSSLLLLQSHRGTAASLRALPRNRHAPLPHPRPRPAAATTPRAGLRWSAPRAPVARRRWHSGLRAPAAAAPSTAAAELAAPGEAPCPQLLEELQANFLTGYKHLQTVEHAYWIEDSMVRRPAAPAPGLASRLPGQRRPRR
jgi:hypothetical protein